MPTNEGKPRTVPEVMADAADAVGWVTAMVLSLGYRCRIKPRGKAGRVHGSGLKLTPEPVPTKTTARGELS